MVWFRRQERLRILKDCTDAYGSHFALLGGCRSGEDGACCDGQTELAGEQEVADVEDGGWRTRQRGPLPLSSWRERSEVGGWWAVCTPLDYQGHLAYY